MKSPGPAILLTLRRAGDGARLRPRCSRRSFCWSPGSNPVAAFGDMLNHASKLETMIDMLNRATPLYIAGVAAAIGFRMNLFNIGVEGQYLLAALVAAAVGGVVDLPAGSTSLFIMLVAMTVGAAYAGFAGVLKVTRGISEVISTIMLNAIAISGLIVAWSGRWQARSRAAVDQTRAPTPIPEVGPASPTSTGSSRSSPATSARARS